MSKKKIVLIIVLIVILIYFLTVGIRTISRLKKLNIIIDKAIANIEKDNYYLKTTCVNGENKTETIAYYRNGIGRYVAENGIYTWTDGKDAYMVDEENKTIYVLNINNSAEMLISSDMFAYLIPGYNQSFFEKIKIVGNMFNEFTTETVDEEECYKIAVNEEKYVKTTWVSKKSLNPIKATMEFPSGEILKYTYDLKFTATKITSIELPDLDNYKVVDYETNEVIVDEFITEETDSNEPTETKVVE